MGQVVAFRRRGDASMPLAVSVDQAQALLEGGMAPEEWKKLCANNGLDWFRHGGRYFACKPLDMSELDTLATD